MAHLHYKIKKYKGIAFMMFVGFLIYRPFSPHTFVKTKREGLVVRVRFALFFGSRIKFCEWIRSVYFIVDHRVYEELPFCKDKLWPTEPALSITRRELKAMMSLLILLQMDGGSCRFKFCFPPFKEIWSQRYLTRPIKIILECNSIHVYFFKSMSL